MSYLQIVFDRWTAVRFLSITTDRIILSKTGSFTGIRSIATLTEVDLILHFPVIGLSWWHVLEIALRMVNRSVWILVVRLDLIRTIPLIPRSSHSFYILVSTVFLAIIHSHAIYMLRLSLPNYCTHWLGNVVRAHRRVLLTSRTIASKVHLVHIIDTALPHMVFRWHWHLAFVHCSILSLYLHLLISVVAHVIVMYYSRWLWNKLEKVTEYKKYGAIHQNPKKRSKTVRNFIVLLLCYQKYGSFTQLDNVRCLN